jgi:hypothetical protein
MASNTNQQDGLAWWEKAAAIGVFATLALFIFFSVVASFPPPGHEPHAPWLRFLPFVGLICLSVSFGVWFIACFTGDPDDPARRQQSFRFAYVFTMTTFVVLIFPVTNPWQPDVNGPISLIRGCVDASTDKTVPDSIVCGADDLGPGFSSGVPAKPFMTTPEPATAESSPLAPDAGVSSPGSGSTANQNGGTSEKVGAATIKRRNRAHPGYVNVRSFPWLIVIGGTYGTASQESGTYVADSDNASGATPPSSSVKTNAKVAPPSGSSTVESESLGADIKNTNATAQRTTSPSGASDATGIDPLLPFSVIQGGFVVPYYVVLIAFMGGAVSLTRRIPEYQKQSEGHYVGTVALPNMTACEARENVVFEIMQLITAPFIAMVAFYTLAPSTMAGGVTTAFLAGFSSSLVLLQLRGMFEGLYPQSTAKDGGAANVGTVTGTVRDAENAAVPGVTVQVRGRPTLNATTDAQGAYKIGNVPTGQQDIDVTAGGRTGTVQVQVKATTNNVQDILIK